MATDLDYSKPFWTHTSPIHFLRYLQCISLLVLRPVLVMELPRSKFFRGDQCRCLSPCCQQLLSHNCGLLLTLLLASPWADLDDPGSFLGRSKCHCCFSVHLFLQLLVSLLLHRKSLFPSLHIGIAILSVSNMMEDLLSVITKS